MGKPGPAVKVNPDEDPAAWETVDSAIDSSCPHLYCNGFINVMSNADILTVLQRNGKTVGTLNMSFTMAKTLSAALGQVIGDLEQSTGREIMTVVDVLGDDKDNKKISGEEI